MWCDVMWCNVIQCDVMWCDVVTLDCNPNTNPHIIRTLHVTLQNSNHTLNVAFRTVNKSIFRTLTVHLYRHTNCHCAIFHSCRQMKHNSALLFVSCFECVHCSWQEKMRTRATNVKRADLVYYTVGAKTAVLEGVNSVSKRVIYTTYPVRILTGAPYMLSEAVSSPFGGYLKIWYPFSYPMGVK